MGSTVGRLNVVGGELRLDAVSKPSKVLLPFYYSFPAQNLMVRRSKVLAITFSLIRVIVKAQGKLSKAAKSTTI